jgi:hypothetical protein
VIGLADVSMHEREKVYLKQIASVCVDANGHGSMPIIHICL